MSQENRPGGAYTIQSTDTAAVLDSSALTMGAIIIRSAPTNSIVYWGFGSPLVAADQRGFVLPGEWIVIGGPIAPNAVYVSGTAANVIYWSGDPVS